MNSLYKRRIFNQAAKVAHLTYQIGETDLLRRKSSPINLADLKSEKIQKIILKLKDTLLSYKKLTGKGKGISAVQIGIPLKIAVVFIGKIPTVFINPKIIKISSRFFSYPEICMSANPIVVQVIRPHWIEFEYFDEMGLMKNWNKKDKLFNRVLQHEIDHMEGIINIDLSISKNLILDSDPNFFRNAKFKLVKAV